jgi:hypothetical protein
MSAFTVADIVAALREEMSAELRPVEYDLTIDDETGDIELATDDWTLSIGGVPVAPTAWVAIDAEPEVAHEYEKARQDAFRSAEIAALRRANHALDGLLSQALNASEDDFSIYIAGVLSAEPEST